MSLNPTAREFVFNPGAVVWAPPAAEPAPQPAVVPPPVPEPIPEPIPQPEAQQSSGMDRIIVRIKIFTFNPLVLIVK